MSLRDRMTDLADSVPVNPLPAGFAQRVRRRHRTRRVCAAGAVVLALLIGGYALSPALPPAPATGKPARQDPGLPAQVQPPSRWTADHREDPIGPAVALAVAGEAVPGYPRWGIDPSQTVNSLLVSLTGHAYRLLPGEVFLVSPDGRAVTFADGLLHDLATGARIGTVDPPVAYSENGRFLVFTQLSGMAYVRPLDTPDAAGQWRVATASDGRSPYLFAASPDGLRLAAGYGDGGVAVFQRDDASEEYYGSLDGRLGWRRTHDRTLLAGSAAWTPSGRVAVWRWAQSGSCDNDPRRRGWSGRPAPCPVSLGLLDAATGEQVSGPAYPLLDGGDWEVVGWRGDSAYATVSRGPDGARHVDLVRLDPGAAGPVTLVTTPPGTYRLLVATDYLDRIRPAGAPESGFNGRMAWGWAARALVLCGIPLLLVALPVWLLRWRRRRRAAAR
ncbi:hypothetical protein [Catellatospora tritici]|uniref:hypothetical protein n=1 Tax=Catellatospora tritici TaxID=2851566 RepID=UPI001C2D0497|nr:hypothetical protein [Catellatospora tritici]MBV1853222.1 hypothetical protein [Catellatospora tritici]